ncbi:MAG: hypothetical protein IT458_18315 [Planctomycetes bacterium]|nr:hypothetical protein [Planctomycetota bacterium]
MLHAFRAVSALLVAALAAVSLPSQAPFASRVVGFDTQGGAGGGIFAPQQALGAPQGGGPAQGSLHVHSLGTGGWLHLGFDLAIVDGPGADLIVSENPFFAGVGQSFAEFGFVEVSSNGVDFARFPSAYFGPSGGPGAFGVLTVGSAAGLAGQTPVRAGSATTPGADPFDVVDAGGDAFDLADLRAHPLVQNGLVRLDGIRHVRLVDVVDGVSRDARGVPIRDHAQGSADIDAVTVLHHAAELTPNHPRVEVVIPADGNFEIRVDDPDGFADLDLATLRVAVYGVPIAPMDLLGAMTFPRVDATGFTARLGGPLPPGFLLQLAVSVRDRAGHRSGAVRQRG